jgi:hypothetical protein
MVTSITKRVHVKSVGFAASLTIIGLAFAAEAGAACLDAKTAMPRMSGTAGAAHLVPAVYRPDGLRGAELVAVSDFEDEESSIVGLWQFKFAGFIVDWGTEAFHSDGTELIFSGGQNPETGDVCQGVWRKVGPNTYTLNHIAMGWLAPGAGFGIRVHFHAIINVNSTGHGFTGTYRATVYSVSPANPFDESIPVVSGNGTMTGSRVQPD